MTDDPTVAVLGAGVMGTGISTLIVGQGLPIVLVDVDEAALERARGAGRRRSPPGSGCQSRPGKCYARPWAGSLRLPRRRTLSGG